MMLLVTTMWVFWMCVALLIALGFTQIAAQADAKVCTTDDPARAIASKVG